jgi:hypothetical protein
MSIALYIISQISLKFHKGIKENVNTITLHQMSGKEDQKG